MNSYYSEINKKCYLLSIKQKDASWQQSHWSVRHLDSYESSRGRTQFYSEINTRWVFFLSSSKILYIVALSHIYQYNNTTIYFYLVINDKRTSTAEPSDWGHSILHVCTDKVNVINLHTWSINLHMIITLSNSNTANSVIPIFNVGVLTLTPKCSVTPLPCSPSTPKDMLSSRKMRTLYLYFSFTWRSHKSNRWATEKRRL